MAEEHPRKPEDDLTVYFFVMLRKGPVWSPDVTPEVEATQAAHLAHIEAMADAGKLLLAGPFIDSPVDDWRGIFVLKTDSLEEAQAITANDPAVQSGRLSMDVIPWATGRGRLLEDGIPYHDYTAE